ncbi:MAG: hypothetical protein AAF415_18225 [Pseudomonadota bacterium]
MTRLHDIAHGRAGDKGNTSNISVIAYDPTHWPLLVEQVTVEKVLEIFRPLGATAVDRFELPNLLALNFVIHDTLGGGVNSSLSLDRHGKCLSFKLLGEITLDDALGSAQAAGR